MAVDVVVDTTATDTRFPGPWIDVRTSLARLHVADAALVPQVAYFRVVTLLRSVLRIKARRDFLLDIPSVVCLRVLNLMRHTHSMRIYINFNFVRCIYV